MKIDDAIKFFEKAAKASARLGTEKLELGAVAHIAYGSYSQIAEWLKELKQRRTIDAVSEWIPCSERLPEERQDVYVTVFWDDYGDTITAYGMRTRFGWLLWNTAEGELIKGYTVTAWMPLPKPYAADRKTEPTISKMEQVDKDINVRSKEKPQTERSE